MFARRLPDGSWIEINGDFVAGDVQYPDNWIALATDDERAAIGLHPITETEQPDGVVIVGSRIEDQDGVATRRWLTQPIPVPEAVSPRQLRLALLGANLLDQITAFVASSSVPAAARISWEYATEYRRDDPTLNAMAKQLQPPMGDAQIDQLFIAAAAIP